MAPTTEEIFGDAEGVQPATPGSYGEPPSGFRLPPATRLGKVRLRVADLGRSAAWYQATLGLRLLDRTASQAILGNHGEDVVLVELEQQPGTRPAPRRGVFGLYHFAILLPDRPALGRFVRHLADIGAKAGAGDHLVSESFYLQDPDNLGIEVYADRPRSTWRRVGRQLMMATDPVDVEGVIAAAGNRTWDGMPRGTVMGHLHLHVGGLAAASSFYSGTLGFDRMVWQYPGALFLAADGYHHHLGTNTWAGPGAGKPDDDLAQLLEWTIRLPDQGGFDSVTESLARAGTPMHREVTGFASGSILTEDPWGTPVRLRLDPTP
jgi:catechol 2,3-dioxygenase